MVRADGMKPGSAFHEVNLKVLEEQVQLAQVVVVKVEEVVCGPWEHALQARDRFLAVVERAQHERLTRLVLRRRKTLREVTALREVVTLREVRGLGCR